MRDGIILLFYDVPFNNKKDCKNYRLFFKTLRKEGYVALQESVFYKYIRNVSMQKYELARIKKSVPKEGNVLCLILSYLNFTSMVALAGNLPDFDAVSSPVIFQ